MNGQQFSALFSMAEIDPQSAAAVWPLCSHSFQWRLGPHLELIDTKVGDSSRSPILCRARPLKPDISSSRIESSA